MLEQIHEVTRESIEPHIVEYAACAVIFLALHAFLRYAESYAALVRTEEMDPDDLL
ncbi:MAG TPA: hypothetical protein VIF40_18240 [Methylosinus sp.]|jgi:hypothetical protein|uniref:hypothetical protein n=1 Tax=Methylosinus sp. TaxID=427 RepID=UPI002F91DD89